MNYNSCFRIAFISGIILLSLNNQRLASQTIEKKSAEQIARSVISLDGEWLLAKDSLNIGRTENWWKASVPEAQPIKVPWILQDVFPAYHGVVWYWRNFEVPQSFAFGPLIMQERCGSTIFLWVGMKAERFLL